MEPKRVLANEINFAFLEHGEGSLMLLLHGFPDNAQLPPVRVESFAIPDIAHTVRDEIGGPTASGQTGPWLMTGVAWEDASSLAVSNGFALHLTDAASVALETAGMGLIIDEPVTVRATLTNAADVRLIGGWPAGAQITADRPGVSWAIDATGLVLHLPAGTPNLDIVGS